MLYRIVDHKKAQVVPRSHKAKKGVSNSIAPFQAFSLTNNKFKWLHPEAWEYKQQNFFLEKRSKQPGQILFPPRYSVGRTKNRASFGGHWVLELASKDPRLCAWVELHCFYKSFNIFFAFFSNLEGDESWSQDRADELSQMISAFFIVGSCDQIEIASGDVGMSQIKELNWGPTRTVLQLETDTILRPGITEPFKKCELLTISASEWWLRENAKKDLADLSYLVRRIRMQKEQLEKLQEPDPKRLGLFSSLFGRR